MEKKIENQILDKKIEYAIFFFTTAFCLIAVEHVEFIAIFDYDNWLHYPAVFSMGFGLSKYISVIRPKYNEAGKAWKYIYSFFLIQMDIVKLLEEIKKINIMKKGKKTNRDRKGKGFK